MQPRKSSYVHPSPWPNSYAPSPQIKSGKIGSLFRPDTFLSGFTGAGNNWAKVSFSRELAIATVLTRAPPRGSTPRGLNWWTASLRFFVVKLKHAMLFKASRCCTRLAVVPVLALGR